MDVRYMDGGNWHESSGKADDVNVRIVTTGFNNYLSTHAYELCNCMWTLFGQPV